MTSVLKDNTVVRDPASGAPRLLIAGAVLPDWAEGLVGPHLLVADELVSSEPAPVVAPAVPPAGGDSGGRDPGDPDAVPPRGGPGSGRDAWVAFAAKHGVDVDEDLARDDIVELLEQRGVITPE